MPSCSHSVSWYRVCCIPAFSPIPPTPQNAGGFSPARGAPFGGALYLGHGDSGQSEAFLVNASVTFVTNNNRQSGVGCPDVNQGQALTGVTPVGATSFLRIDGW